jgi:hypothetical protein
MCNERQIQMSFFSPIHEDIKILKSNSNIIVLLKLYFYVADVAEWSTGHEAKELVLQCINSLSSNPVEGEPKNVSSKI